MLGLDTLARRALLAAVVLTVATVGTLPQGVTASALSDGRWIGSWTTATQGVVGAPSQYSNQTLRLIVRTTIGGNQVRVRLSNEVGTQRIVIGSAHIALRSVAESIDRNDRSRADIWRLRFDYRSGGCAGAERSCGTGCPTLVGAGGQHLPTPSNACEHRASAWVADIVRVRAQLGGSHGRCHSVYVLPHRIVAVDHRRSRQGVQAGRRDRRLGRFDHRWGWFER